MPAAFNIQMYSPFRNLKVSCPPLKMGTNAPMKRNLKLETCNPVTCNLHFYQTTEPILFAWISHRLTKQDVLIRLQIHFFAEVFFIDGCSYNGCQTLRSAKKVKVL